MSDDDINDDELNDEIEDLLDEMGGSEDLTPAVEATDGVVHEADSEDTLEPVIDEVINDEPVQLAEGIDESIVSASAIGAQKRIPIIIHEGGDTDPTDVFVSVNGRTFQIKRGVRVNVPQCVLNVLDDAIASRLVREGTELEGDYVLRDKPRFSYQRLSE